MELGFNTKITSNLDELEAAIARLEALDGKKTEAGIFGGFAQQKAMWQEYGTSRGIPARPFLRNTMYEQSSKWTKEVGKDVLAVFNGSMSPNSVAFKVGSLMVKDIRKTIDDGNFAPLSPATIAKKGNDKPLVDTGDMYDAIRHKES